VSRKTKNLFSFFSIYVGSTVEKKRKENLEEMKTKNKNEIRRKSDRLICSGFIFIFFIF